MRIKMQYPCHFSICVRFDVPVSTDKIVPNLFKANENTEYKVSIKRYKYRHVHYLLVQRYAALPYPLCCL